MLSKFKFIQTSDLHLDGDFSCFGDFENTLKKALKVTFELIISLAKRDKVDAILIAGNLFNTPNPSKETVDWVIAQLSSIAPAKVLITPGCSDPCVDGSVYRTTEWPENVVVFTEKSFTPHILEENNVVIYGFAHQSSAMTANPVTSFKPSRYRDMFSIMLFHGSIIDVGYPDKNPTAPFKFIDLVNTGCDYSALGHFHRLQSLKRKDEKVILGCYSGIPQGLDFEDEGEKGVLEVTILGGNREINFLPTARAKFQSFTVDCQEFRNEEELMKYIEKLLDEKNAGRMLTRIVLTGGIDAEKTVSADNIRSAFEKKCFYLHIEDKTVTGYDVDRITSEETTKGYFTRSMLDKLTFINESLKRDDDPQLKEQKEILELALEYGLDAFTRGEVKHRW
jgi:DNA repair protein SbcD/Mre11